MGHRQRVGKAREEYVGSGKMIRIDIPARTVDVLLSEEELQARRERMEAKSEGAWQPEKARPRKVSAALRAYAKLVTSADRGAVRDLSQL